MFNEPHPMKVRRQLNPNSRRRLKADAREQWLCELEMSDTVLRERIQELEKKVRESEDSRNKFLALYNHSPVGYVTLDQKGRIRDANAAAIGLLGVDPAERPVLPFTLLLHQEDAAQFLTHLSRFEGT